MNFFLRYSQHSPSGNAARASARTSHEKFERSSNVKYYFIALVA